jgi:hypothetical protein
MKTTLLHCVLPALAATLTLWTGGVAYAQYTISTLASSSSAASIYGDGVAVDATQRVYTTGSVPQVGTNGLPDGASNTVILALTHSVVPVVGGISSNNSFAGCNLPAVDAYDTSTAVGMTDLAGVAVDASGNIYVAQSGNGPILKVQGVATCLLNDDYFFATAITTDSVGNAYFAASASNGPGYVVYQITTAGALVTFAGNGAFGCGNGTFGDPRGLTVDGAGDLYIADSFCNVIWKVSSAGASPSVVAGNGIQGYSGDGGSATSASVCEPRGVAVDYYRNLFIADSCNNRIREVSASSQTIETIAGTGAAGLSGDGGTAQSAELDVPWGIAVGSDGMIYFADQVIPFDTSARVRQLAPPSARITSPASGSILPSTSVTFTWTGTSVGTEFHLEVSDALGKIYFNGSTAATSQIVSNLPHDGRALYVELQTYLGGQWLSAARYTYRACPMIIAATPDAFSQQGGTTTLTVDATDIWSGEAAVRVTEAVYPMICSTSPLGTGCPQPAQIGATVEILPGSSKFISASVPIPSVPSFETYATSHVFVATLTVNGTAVFSSSTTVTN